MRFTKMKDLREDMEMTQQNLANILKVDRSTYAGWETGKDTIPLKKLSMLCDYLEITIDFLTGLSNENNFNKINNKQIILSKVGNNLKILRQNENLKQKDIIKFLNIASSTYSGYETGKYLISTSFIYAISKKYNYSIDWILGKTGKNF